MMMNIVTAPRPPENVTATSDGPDAITVHWFPSVSDGVVKYQITVVMANATENKLPDYFVSPHVEEVSATTTTYTVSDLKPNTKYAAFMKAMGLEAASQPSEVVFQETKDVTRLCACLSAVLLYTCLFFQHMSHFLA